MQHRQLEFHNVVELQSRGSSGLHLQRFPAAIRHHPLMNELGRLVMQKAIGAEIRFATNAPRIRISLGALEEDNQVVVLLGDHAISHHRVPAGQTVHLLINRPPAFDYFVPEYFRGCRFAPTIWRIWMGQECALFHDLDTFGHEVRPPQPEEKPRSRWLAYGSSFTMGGGAFNHFNNYVDLAARLLGVDGVNLGMGGSCLCEPHVADYLASRDDWDFCTLRIGCNMIGVVEPDEYRRRVAHLLDVLEAKQPGKPVLFIGLGAERVDLHRTIGIWQEHTRAYAQINRELLAERRDRPHLHACTREALMPDPKLVRADHGHPDDLGHFTIATHLAELLHNLGIARHPATPTT